MPPTSLTRGGRAAWDDPWPATDELLAQLVDLTALRARGQAFDPDSSPWEPVPRPERLTPPAPAASTTAEVLDFFGASARRRGA